MRTGKGSARLLGKNYSAEEYNLIFILHIMGLFFREIARILGRQEDDIRRAWDRLCVNGTNYPDKRLYRLKPLTTRESINFGGPAKEYIEVQWSKVKKRPTIRQLSRRMGIVENTIVIFIKKNNDWKKKPRPKLIGD